jgi:predicted nucleic acid-binding protein
MLVLDASIAVTASSAPEGFDEFASERLVAPALMWSEARSALHELACRGMLAPDIAAGAWARLERGPIEERRHRSLGKRAWELADRFGWAKTYDAEYVALADLLGCRLLTLDLRLRRATDRLGFVVVPAEL